MSQQAFGSQTIFEIIVNFFKEDNWLFEEIKSEAVLQMAFQGKSGRWSCYAQFKDVQHQFIFYSVCPITAPESQRLTVAEFIARANYGLTIGNFELDFRDGEIRYKTSIDIEDDRLSFVGIKNLVYTNVNMMDKYLPGIISVIAGDVSPEFAINQIDQNIEVAGLSNGAVAADAQKDLVLDISSQTDLQPQEGISDKEPHILTILTPDEIAKFHQALQVMPHYQRKQAEAIIETLKKELIARLGELEEEIFTQGYNFFSEVKIDIKNLKLIQRYSGLADRAKLLLRSFSNGIEECRQLTVEMSTSREELENVFWSINERLQELPTDKLEGRREVELLIEIEEFRSQLAGVERLIKR
ncbi:hypothetical protein NIES4074_19800 [Cylindrospermum sp. NIES-4074]|nr:hypothetical protein NIES4074_19800 [Cylindrospermum sp. NIES-4074]